jgi:mono/diheme cytochrome c family protein
MKRNIYTSMPGLGALALLTAGLALAGCSTPASTGSSPTGAASARKPSIPDQSGATLWAQNCGRCHNIRSPDSLSDAQWDVVALHMRVRANLTAEEHRQILAFLKSAH